MKQPSLLIRWTAAPLLAAAAYQAVQAQTITTGLAAPAGSVDTTKPGFKVRIVQGNSRLPLTSAAPAEALLSGRAIDATTGLPFENLAEPGPEPGGLYAVPTVLNWHEQAASGTTGGNFSGDTAIPGIPGTTGSGDYFVMEATGFMQLPAGTHRLGVNSDDGFKLTFGTGINPLDKFTPLQVAILDGTRGFANTEVNVTVSTAGIYPFRLIWWENTGANSGIEFFNFAPGTTSGTRYLVNDAAQANAFKTYRELVTPISTPIATFVSPAAGSTTSGPRPFIEVDLLNQTTSVNTTSIQLSLDGAPLVPNITEADGKVRISALAPLVNASSAHTARLIYSDSTGTSITNSWAFTTAAYTTIPASFAVPSVDATKPGFKTKVYQYDNVPTDQSQNIARGPGGTGLVPNAERQLARGYNDPATGLPYPNTASPQWIHADAGAPADDLDADGFFIVPGVVNWVENAGGAATGGNFTSASNPPMPDDNMPGLPGTAANAGDRAVYSIETILELKAGAYRFGVNSDDGFRLSFGQGPGDVVGIQLATAGDRGFADTTVDFRVAADGLYPVRLMYFESTGGTGVEFFAVDLVTGVKTLINDTTSEAGIKAYRESAASRPYISRVLPAVGDQFVHADRDLEVDIQDGAIPVDAASIELRLNGAVVPVTPSKSGSLTRIRRAGSVTSLLGSGNNNVSVIYSYTAGATTTLITNNWSFNVPAYTVMVPAANRVPQASVSNPGFNARGHLMDRSLDANQGNGGRFTGNGGGGNNMPRPEIQLAQGYINRTNGTPFSNRSLPGSNPDGSYEVPGVINWNSANVSGVSAAANSGIFAGGANPADEMVPGLPGTGTSNLGMDNFVQEIVTHLSLKKGAHLLAVNCDDGFVLSSAPNPRDTLGTFLGRRDPGGGNSGSLVTAAALNVIIPEDGIYPFRLLWWQGGGGVNVEFFSVDRDTGRHVLINDTANTSLAIPAFSTYSGPARPWVQFSVYPMQSMYQNQHQQGGPGPIKVVVGAGNPADIASESPAIRPFGDAVGAIVADAGSENIGLTVDGTTVTPTVTDLGGGQKRVLYTPSPAFASGSTHTAGLVYAGTTNFWTFTVITNVAINAGTAVAASQVDTSKPGFRVKVVQAVAGQANTVARAEAQLAGTPASVAQPGTGPDGSHIVPGIINWSTRRVSGQSGAEIGNFIDLLGRNDAGIPGLPGTGLTGTAAVGNAAAEIFAWLDLPAGYHKFGIAGDDGFALKVGQPGDATGQVLFSIDRGAGARDFPVAFTVPEAGLYPIRLIWYQGGGDGNLEFFTFGLNNDKIPVNDPTHPAAVKAYYALKAAPVVAIEAIAGGNVRLTFTGKLQRTDSLTTPNWQDVAGAVSPLEVTPEEARFFRTVAE